MCSDSHTFESVGHGGRELSFPMRNDRSLADIFVEGSPRNVARKSCFCKEARSRFRYYSDAGSYYTGTAVSVRRRSTARFINRWAHNLDQEASGKSGVT